VLFAAGDAGDFFLEALAFGGVFGFGELVGEFEEAVVLGLFCLQAGLDEVDEDAAGGGVTGFGQCADALGDARWERDTLTDGLLRRGVSNGLVDCGHETILRQIGRVWVSG
jgi:hypothetical protein